jgi:copper chaperone NosL
VSGARSLLAAAAALLACARGAPSPAPLDPATEACASCRMVVSDPRTAAQLVAPGEEPRFFDDLGCLRRHLAAAAPPRGAVAYVADHRTGAWVRADRAVYTLQPRVETPMGSHLLAHADAASRDADPAVVGGSPRAPGELFGPGGPPASEAGRSP